jgi:hypothetical protein
MADAPSICDERPILTQSAVLDTLPRVSADPHVIVGGKTGANLVNLEKTWRRIRKAGGLTDVRLHDLCR